MRRYRLITLIIGAAISVLMIVALIFPAPPAKIVIAAGIPGTELNSVAVKYQNRMRQMGYVVDLLEASTPSIGKLATPNGGLDVVFVNAGLTEGKKPDSLVSLGAIYTSAVWIFTRTTDKIHSPSELKGKKIIVGAGVGAGSYLVATKVLAQFGVTPGTATFLPLPTPQALEAWSRSEVDAVVYYGMEQQSLIARLLRDPNAALLNFEMAGAFVRRNPDFRKMAVPRGAIDLEKGLPSNDLVLVGVPVSVVVRRDLHPEIMTALLYTMTHEHSGPGALRDMRAFPNVQDTDFPVAEVAADYHANGPSFLHRHIPLWMTTTAKRGIGVLVAVLAISVPLANYGPRVYRWFIRQRLLGVYRGLRRIDAQLQSDLTADAIFQLQTELEKLEKKASQLEIPSRQSDLHFSYKVHVNLIRTRVAARLSQIRSAQS